MNHTFSLYSCFCLIYARCLCSARNLIFTLTRYAQVYGIYFYIQSWQQNHYYFHLNHDRFCHGQGIIMKVSSYQKLVSVFLKSNCIIFILSICTAKFGNLLELVFYYRRSMSLFFILILEFIRDCRIIIDRGVLGHRALCSVSRG